MCFMNCDAYDPADFTQAGSAMSCCSSETVFEVDSIITVGSLDRTSSAEVLYEMQVRTRELSLSKTSMVMLGLLGRTGVLRL